MRRLWITADQLASRLGVSVKSIRRAYWKGEIPVIGSADLSASTWKGSRKPCKPMGVGRLLGKPRGSGGRAARKAARAGGARSGPAPDGVRRGRP